MTDLGVVNGVDTEIFQATIDAVNDNPNSGATSWRVTTKWTGGLKTEATLRQFTLSFDEPEAIAGDDTTQSPHETVLACYGACLTVGMSLNAAMRGIELKKVEVELEGLIDLPGFLGLAGVEGLKDQPGFHTVKAAVHVHSEASEEDIQSVFDRASKYSPVGLTLSKPVKIENSLVING
ncbi:MAG TPA: OsmC family protein [Nitrospinota bacterium]|mgnify:CR=1 FL=1|nr:OsmC family protein [Nitrospinota bacterium]|tara:strand:+ start:57950 stop:58486 length:537 start_codon:yes stop_codon:yes gene_type:complete